MTNRGEITPLDSSALKVLNAGSPSDYGFYVIETTAIAEAVAALPNEPQSSTDRA
jgi:hypothetical protein